jgi:hypothetical protein
LLDEEEQVHALVLSFLQQVVDPPMVSFEGSETAQVSGHATDHSGNASHSLKEDNAVHPVALGHLLGIISREVIERPSSELNSTVGYFVLNPLRRLVGYLNMLNVCHLVHGVRHAVGLGVHHKLVLRQLVKQGLSFIHNK